MRSQDTESLFIASSRARDIARGAVGIAFGVERGMSRPVPTRPSVDSTFMDVRRFPPVRYAGTDLVW